MANASSPAASQNGREETPRARCSVLSRADSALEVCDLGMRYGSRTLFSEMCWTLPRGKTLAITGDSGSGKTSLLHLLAGELAASEGEIKFGAAGGNVGVLFQNFRLTPNLSVMSNVLCGKLGEYRWWQTLLGFPASERAAAYRLLCKFGLQERIYALARDTSGGEQQRTALARVLLQGPEILLADEPTSNLDNALALRVMSALREEAGARNGALICVLHQRELVEEFADFELTIDERYPNHWRFRAVLPF